MKFSEKLRNSAFWFIDFLKQGKVKFHLEDISFILQNFQTDASVKRRQNHISKILSHAATTVPFYKGLKKKDMLTDFPVVNKIILRSQLDRFISEKYKNKPNFKVSTSGSTGTPLVVFQDKNKRHRNTADTLYFGQKAGYEIGQKLFYMKAWSSLLKKSNLVAFLQNIKPVNVRNLDYENISQLLREVTKSSSTNAFVGYTSGYKAIWKYLDSVNALPLKTNISAMIAIAEPLGVVTKKKIKHYFGMDMLSRYSNMENGILSQQIKGQGVNYHINWASYYIEILDLNKDEPVPHGTLGRVVVTDLFNFNMPLIRYDTGDLAIMDVDSNHFNSAPCFTKVEGRRMDVIYDTKGRVMTTAVYELEYFSEFKQSQLIQEGEKSYLVKINMDGVFNQEEKLIEIMSRFLGDDAIIKFEYVNEIPQLSSGKMKLTLNTYKP